MDTVTVTADEPAEEAIHDAVVAAVEEVEHRHDVEEQLDRIEDTQGAAWQATQAQVMSLSERVASMETTLSMLAMRQEAVAEEVAEVQETVEEVAEESSAEEVGTPNSEEITLTPPEPEPEHEPKKASGFSPLRSVLKPRSR